jgi:phosphoribosylglycinamide formyltransferase-1
MRVGVLASGRGSNLQALLRSFPMGHNTVQLVCVISNRLNAEALQHARAANVPAFGLPLAGYASRGDQQAAMANVLRDAGVELVVLAGYDQILTSEILRPFEGRIVNIHPSLLPAFAGTLHAQAAALAHGVKVSGCTVHFVIEDIDQGPIIAQAAVPVLETDTEETLAQRILEQEHTLLPKVVEWIAEGRVRVEGRRVRIAEGAANASITQRIR